MAVNAPDSHKELDVNETFIRNVTKVLWEARRAGAKHFYIARGLSVELGLLGTDDDDVEELNEMYGPLFWQGCENDQGGFKKLMWHAMMKVFNCKVRSTWSSCDREWAMAFHAQTTWERW